MSKKKVLIFIDWFLPGTNSGGPVRSYVNLIDHFEDDFTFYIVTRNLDYLSKSQYKNTIPDNWNKLNEHTNVYYISPGELKINTIRKIYKHFDADLVLVNGIYSFYFSILPVLISRKRRQPTVVSARGMLSPQAFCVKRIKKKLFLRLSRFLNLYKNVVFHATNEFESECIKQIIGHDSNVIIAPNLPRKFKITNYTKAKKESPVRFVNISRISQEKGTLKLLQILKMITYPVIIDVYGPVYDFKYWEKCKKVISILPNNIQFSYKGQLASDEVIEVLPNYDFFVMLSEGENFGHSILEALAVGLPVLISNMTPWRNLESHKIGWDVDTDIDNNIINAFNTAINMDHEEYNLWSFSAMEYSKEFINNVDVLKMNRNLLDLHLSSHSKNI